MISDESKAELIEEFPELGASDVLLIKEVYAHFGLAFMKFGLVEHSLINVLTFHEVGTRMHAGKITTRQEWEAAFDVGQANAIASTFGNLVKNVSTIAEFADLRVELAEVKKVRNYFAHHFMRREAEYADTDAGCWLLLSRIADVRHKTIELEDALRPRFEAMNRRLKLPAISEERIRTELEMLVENAEARLSGGTAKVGWEE